MAIVAAVQRSVIGGRGQKTARRPQPAAQLWPVACRAAPRSQSLVRATAETEQLEAAGDAPDRAVQQQQQPASSSNGSRLAAGGKRVAVLQASKSAALDVKEAGRPLGEQIDMHGTPGRSATARLVAPHLARVVECPALS